MTPDRPPVACSLSGTDLRERYRDLAAFGEANLIARSSDGDGEHLRFAWTALTEEKLRAIIAAEQECCPFLDFELTANDDELLLRIGCAEDGRLIAAELAAAFD